MVGSMIPFAKTRAEREISGDPRPSIAERYTSKTDYLKQVDRAAVDLEQSRFLLNIDLKRIHDKAAAHWDSIMTPTVSR